jgi:two-component system response regulator
MKTLSLLLIEDDLNDELLTLWSLKQEKGFEITVVRDGQQALDYFSNQGAAQERLPDVVLLDLHLPKVDGWKVIEFIRGQDRTRHMPVIILASSQDITRQLDAHQGSETAVIPKPVQAAEVLKALERMSHAQLL